MPRKARKEPTRAPDPLDQYSTWDLRIAKMIYYSIILASAITILGIWLTIIGWLIESGQWAIIESWGLGAIALIIVGIIVLHLFLLVLFYVLFRGGILKLCQRVFKDRVLAKKYEDYTTLRLLLAVTLVSVYLFLITLALVILPSIFWNFVWGILIFIGTHFNAGEWVLFVGIVLFIIVILVYLGFVLWNHGVFAVLKRVKRIEEEYEVEEEIKRDELKGADEETLQKLYNKQTGKKAIYRGKETKGYISWKRSMLS
ncbi:MAG TPA: hypothetical protein VMV43_07255 [Candidatus Nanopelagicaceae bacterium]|nr:hypothetical protein [Candidatus Nanopelagicaceae bacterium]